MKNTFKPSKRLGFYISRINLPLIIGFIIITALLVFSIYPDYFTTSDPYGKERMDFVYIDGELNFFQPPVAPCPEYPWGTDSYGRDMKSLLFYGARLTLFTAIMIAFGRLLIALPLAILAGYKNSVSILMMRQFSIMFSAFPLVIIAMLFSRIKLVSDIFQGPISIVAYLLIFFGWSRLANLLKEKVEEVLSQDFIEGEIAIGKNKLELAFQNIIPHLLPSIVVLFFLEIAQALLILAQVGVFGLVTSTGGVDAAGDYRIPFQVEWVSLLASPQWPLVIGKYWLVIYPAAAFAVSIIGFNLFGEGLRMELEKRSSRIVSWIRAIPAFLSPARLIYEIRNFNMYKANVRRKLAFYAVVLVIAFFPQSASRYQFDTANALSTINELSKAEYEGRKAGSGSNQKIADYLASTLQKYNIAPYDGKYLHEFEMNTAFNVKNSTLAVKKSSEAVKELVFRKDYYIVNPKNINGTYELVYHTMESLGVYPYTYKPVGDMTNKIMLIDIRGLDGLAASRFIGFAINLKPVALMYISSWDSEPVIKKRYIDRGVTEGIETINISVSSNQGEKLIDLSGSKLSLSIDCEYYSNPKSTSVVGILQGTDESLKDEIVIIGSSFDSVGDDEDTRYPSSMEAGGAAIELELARILGGIGKNPERTVVFAFWDSTQAIERGSEKFLLKYFSGSRQAFYIDLKNFGYKEAESLIIDTTNTLPKNYLAQKYIKALKKHGRRNDIGITYGKIGSPVTQDTLRFDVNSIIVDSQEIDEVLRTAGDNLDNIEAKRLKGPGQMLVDTVYDMVYGGIR